MSYHTPVLLKACVDALEIRPDGVYADATFGGGGHSREILRRLGSEGRLFGFDQDAAVAANLPGDSRFTLVPHNFRFMKNYLKLYKAIPLDGLLADLGVSSHQFDEGSRGFSTRFDAPLDMRMDPLQEKEARTVVNTYPEAQLKQVFRFYGELPEAGKLARMLVNRRSEKPVETTGELLALVRPFARRGQEHQFAAQVFQAIRIEVNDELEALKALLLQSAELIKPGGRLVVLSYHSLEDRLVKNYIRSGKFEGEAEKDLFGNISVPFSAVNRKPTRPEEEEINRNSRARSAILRIARRN